MKQSSLRHQHWACGVNEGLVVSFGQFWETGPEPRLRQRCSRPPPCLLLLTQQGLSLHFSPPEDAALGLSPEFPAGVKLRGLVFGP